MNSSAPRKAALRFGRFIANDMQRVGQTSRCGAAPLSTGCSGAGSTRRSSLPLGVSESRSSTTNAEGPHVLGKTTSWRMEGARSLRRSTLSCRLIRYHR